MSVNKKVVIAGGTGFLGKALYKHLSNANYEVSILTRKPTAAHHVSWDGQTEGEWTDLIHEAGVVINLCGKSVDCRYTTANKKGILDSRIIPTQLLNKVIANAPQKPSVFINASSGTVYIHSEDTPMTEENGIIGDDFSMNIVKQWEKAFYETQIVGVRKAALRTSIVLGEGGGALPKLLQITKLGLGGKQGDGNQMVSWIHIDDFCSAVARIITTPELAGSINITSPNPIKNEVFMKAIRGIVKPPFHINQPKWLLEIGAIFMRTETELLFKSRYAIPKILMDNNFKFEFEHIAQVASSIKEQEC